MKHDEKPGQKVIVALRKMIAAGELKNGQRIAEIPTAAALGVSRMPVRTALRMLEQEGLVTRLGARGYAAAGPTPDQIRGAIEVRGVLEGLAAFRLASRGLDAATDARFSHLLSVGDALFEPGHLIEGAVEAFHAYNIAFHDLLIGASNNAALALAVRRNNHLPFASASALALDLDDDSGEFNHLHSAHRQHQAVIDQIRRGDAQMAERLMRDHALMATARESVFATLID